MSRNRQRDSLLVYTAHTITVTTALPPCVPQAPLRHTGNRSSSCATRGTGHPVAPHGEPVTLLRHTENQSPCCATRGTSHPVAPHGEPVTLLRHTGNQSPCWATRGTSHPVAPHGEPVTLLGSFRMMYLLVFSSRGKSRRTSMMACSTPHELLMSRVAI